MGFGIPAPLEHFGLWTRITAIEPHHRCGGIHTKILIQVVPDNLIAPGIGMDTKGTGQHQEGNVDADPKQVHFEEI